MSHDEYYDEIHDGNTYKINTEKKGKKAQLVHCTYLAVSKNNWENIA